MATPCLEAPISVTAERESALNAAERLTQRASLNIIASLLDYFAKMAVGLLLTPILVAGLGRALFGVWEMLGRCSQLGGSFLSGFLRPSLR